MLRDVTITKEEVLKTGSNNGRTWVLYKYGCDDGFSFTTFNQHNLGLQKVEVMEDVNGKFKDWKEVKPKRANPEHDEIMLAFTMLNSRFDKLAEWMKNH